MKQSKGLTILIALVGILLTLSLVATLFVWLNQGGSDDPNGDDNNHSTTDFVVDDYTVYESEAINFKFLVANVSLTFSEANRVSLSQFVTSQQINLSETAVFINDLTSMNIDLEDQNIDYDTFETTEAISLTLFIPVRQSDSDTLTLFFQGKEEVSVLFDLTKNIGDIELLINEDSNGGSNIIEIIEEPDAWRIKIVQVSTIAYKSLTETLEDGSKQDIVLPSTGQVIGVLVDVQSFNGESIIIEDAKYSLIDDNQESTAFGDKVNVEGYTNIINQPIVSAANGYVFFDVYTPDGTTIDQLSEFEFKLNVLDDWISVEVNE